MEGQATYIINDAMTERNLNNYSFQGTFQVVKEFGNSKLFLVQQVCFGLRVKSAHNDRLSLPHNQVTKLCIHLGDYEGY